MTIEGFSNISEPEPLKYHEPKKRVKTLRGAGIPGEKQELSGFPETLKGVAPRAKLYEDKHISTLKGMPQLGMGDALSHKKKADISAQKAKLFEELSRAYMELGWTDGLSEKLGKHPSLEELEGLLAEANNEIEERKEKYDAVKKSVLTSLMLEDPIEAKKWASRLFYIEYDPLIRENEDYAVHLFATMMAEHEASKLQHSNQTDERLFVERLAIGYEDEAKKLLNMAGSTNTAWKRKAR